MQTPISWFPVHSFWPSKVGSIFLVVSLYLLVRVYFFDIETGQFYNLVPEHALAKVEFNRNSIFKDGTGRYYFGAVDGLYSFTDDQLEFEQEDRLNAMELVSIEIFGEKEAKPKVKDRDLQDINNLVLHSSDTNINFHFSLPSTDKEIWYKYRISGIKNEWSAYSLSGSIELTTFPAGEYALEVRGYTSVDSNNFAKYNLIIEKPKVWFRKTWVQLLFMGLLGALIGFIINYRYRLILQNQKRLEGLRIRISSDLHDDVGTLLSGIAMRSELMYYEDQHDKERRTNLKMLSEMSREAMDSMRDVVWAIDSRKDKYGDLLVRMRSFAEQILESKDISHKFKVDGINNDEFIDPQSRQNYYLLFKEAITNIVKHSDATMVNIDFIKKSGTYILTIHDNGSQKTSIPSGGLGMSNMKMRAKRLGGTLRTRFDNGFVVEVIQKEK